MCVASMALVISGPFWCPELLREADRAGGVGLEVVRRAEGAGVLLEEAPDAVDRVVNDDIHRPGPVGAPHRQGPPGPPRQPAIRLLQGTPELLVVGDRGNGHHVHGLSSHSGTPPGTRRVSSIVKATLRFLSCQPRCAWFRRGLQRA